MKFDKICGLLISFLVFSGCYNFEKEFYQELRFAKTEFYRTGKPVQINLRDITKFDWDEVLFVLGNDSFWIDAEDIEEVLNQKTHLPVMTEDLEEFYHRFYFLRNGKIVFERDINAHFTIEDIRINLWHCGDNNFIEWLTVSQSNFNLVPSPKGVFNKKDTSHLVNLFPTCKEIPKWVLDAVSK